MKTDLLIAGQGLAGSLLAKSLLKEGVTVKIIDQVAKVSSSGVAAGILHPITGRRIVKTWMADQLIPYAIACYNDSPVKLFHHLPILEIFTSTQQRNEWLNKSAEESMSGWIDEPVSANNIINGVQLPFGGIYIKNTGWIDVKLLTETYRTEFINKGIFIQDEVQEADLIIGLNEVKWKNHTAGKIIFCNGYRAHRKTFFSYLPFVPAKGEILEIHCPGLNTTCILNRGIYIIPTGNDCFKVGATFNWEDITEIPSENGLDFLTSALKKIITLPYTIINHKAAIRPANKDRRPFIGMHPNHPSVGIFNGLGTKGAMLAPWFAQHFTRHLLYKEALLPDVTIKRYFKLLYL